MNLFHLGPDICGYSTKKVHVIFNYKGKNHLIKKEVKCKVKKKKKKNFYKFQTKCEHPPPLCCWLNREHIGFLLSSRMMN